MTKKIALSLLAFVCILASVGIGAYAAVKYSLAINGKSVKADIKVINGTPYIPLTALSNNLKNVTIKYDAKKGTIKIDEKKPATTEEKPAPTKPANDGLSAAAPAPIGTAVTVNYADKMDSWSYSVRIDQVIRGTEALTMVQNANPNGAALPEGYEYLLAKVTVTCSKTRRLAVFTLRLPPRSRWYRARERNTRTHRSKRPSLN